MKETKHSLARYRVLDRCFSDFLHQYNFQNLQEEVNKVLWDEFGIGIQDRQLRADIQEMRKNKAPVKAIKYDKNKAYYRYSDPDYSYFKNDLSVQEINHLRSTVDMLRNYSGLPSYVWLEETISKLEFRLGLQPANENVISFEQNEQLKGLEYLSSIIDATLSHQTLCLKYCNYSGVETNNYFHPYHIKQYNNRWFVLGLEETEKGNFIYNKALDRIVSIKVTDHPFIPNKDIDFSSFFKDVIGVTVPKEAIETIVLKFDEKRFPYIESKPIHPSQYIVNKEKHVIKISVRPNKELVSLILSYGPQVKVISPEWLKSKIIEKLEENLNIYKSLH